MFTRKRPTSSLPEAHGEIATGIGYDALRFLTQQGLEHTPANYALAWCVKVDRRSLVAITIDTILMDGRKLSQADADRIMIAEVQREKAVAETNDPHHEALRHHTLRLADLTADATTQSSDFGRELTTELSRLSTGTGSVEQIVHAMVERTQSVEAQLSAASREIESLRNEVETIRDDAQRDALTGLFNRRGVLQELGARRRSTSGVVAMCDVDHFKAVNDRFGHGVGDRVLKGVAASLTDSMEGHVVARWGGEEFLVVIDNIDITRATRMLERARLDLAARSFKLRENDQPLGAITMSVGLAPLDGIAVANAIEAADRMLYSAKRQGRNQIAFDAKLTSAA